MATTTKTTVPGVTIDNRWPPMPAAPQLSIPNDAAQMEAYSQQMSAWYYGLQLALNRQFAALKAAVDKLTPAP